jgi:hypothetical protein
MSSEEPRFTHAEYMDMALSDELLRPLGFDSGTSLRKFLEVLIESYRSKESALPKSAERTPAEESEFFKEAERKLFGGNAQDQFRAMRVVLGQLATRAAATREELALIRDWLPDEDDLLRGSLLQ